jgi:2-octaprenyl-6-methoxyphenol hydroxylase
LERLDVWHSLGPCTEIHTIHVSHAGGFGRAVLSAAQAGLPALGYVVSYHGLERALREAIAKTQLCSVVTDAQATAVEGTSPTRVRIQYDRRGQPNSVCANLAVVADGGTMPQRVAPIHTREYEQSAIVANVSVSRSHHNIAYERFTAHGPLALLPHGERYALVWTTRHTLAQELCTQTNPLFLEQLQNAFGERAGRFTDVDERRVAPLVLRVAAAANVPNTILIGNAAQTLHPVAGQGLNLGLRDAWTLAQRMHDLSNDAQVAQLPIDFYNARRRDRESSILITDTLVRAFSNRNLALQWLRGFGLTLLDCLPPAKHAFMLRMMFGAHS